MNLLWLAIVLGLLGVALGLREFWKIFLPLAIAINCVAKGRKDTARKILERLLVTPSLCGVSVKREARFRLSWLLMEKGEYARAAELLQTNLQAALPPAVEANTRQRLAEALEGAGLGEAATAERERTARILSEAPEDVEGLLAQARMLDQQQRFAESYATYERALAGIPMLNHPVRAQTMVQLALAAFNAGMPEKTIQWGEQALTLKPDYTVYTGAHSAAALGYGNLGRLEEAEAHHLAALERATASGHRDLTARYMAQMAMIQARRGRLAEAMQNSEQAKTLSVAERRMVYAVQLECLKAWGRYPEALETAGMMMRAQSFPTPSAQKRMEAAITAEIAVLQAEQGQPEAAQQCNRQALADLENDAKLTAQYRANGVWYLAMLGQRDEARSEAETVEGLLQPFVQSRGVQLSGLAALGRAYFALEDYARSQGYWERYLTQTPDPVDLPKAYYFLGECLRGSDCPTGAEMYYRKAVALDIDTYYARCAARRLAEAQGALRVTTG